MLAGPPDGYGRAEAAYVAPPPPKPVPEHERLFAEGVLAYRADRDAQARALFLKAAETDSGNVTTADELFAGITSWLLGDTATAIEYLEKVVAADGADRADQLVQKYAAGQSLNVPLTPYYTATVPIGTLAGAIVLVELYQAEDRIDDAIALVERFAYRAEREGHPDFLVSLCELYLHVERWDDVLELCGRVQNFADAGSYTLVMLLFKARALAGMELHDSAIEVCTDSLRFKKDRSVVLLCSIRLVRAISLETIGRKAAARKDLVKVVADLPDFPFAQELLAELA